MTAIWKISAAWIAILAAGGVAHAGVVFMSCSGTVNSARLNQFGAKSGPITMAVDVDKGTVSLAGHKPWPIVKNDREITISFAGSFIDGTGLAASTNGIRLYMGGSINRVTGGTMVHLNTGSPHGPQDGLWQLICKPAQPLF